MSYLRLFEQGVPIGQIWTKWEHLKTISMYSRTRTTRIHNLHPYPGSQKGPPTLRNAKLVLDLRSTRRMILISTTSGPVRSGSQEKMLREIVRYLGDVSSAQCLFLRRSALPVLKRRSTRPRTYLPTNTPLLQTSPLQQNLLCKRRT